MKHYYRKYGVIGISIILIIFCLIALDEPGQSLEHYISLLYNRAYFISIYLLVFLLGVIPISSKLFVTEMVTRFKDKFLLTLSFHKQLFIYCIYYSGTYLLTNILVALFFSPNKYFISVVYFGFLLVAFLIQTVGWYYIGSLFLLICTWCKNTAITYFLTVIIVGITASVGYTSTYIQFKYYLSVHEIMYMFFYIDYWVKILMYTIYYILLSAAFLWIMYMILKRTNLIKRINGK